VGRSRIRTAGQQRAVATAVEQGESDQVLGLGKPRPVQSMCAELDTWVWDANGDGVLVWGATPGASLVGELKLVADKVRAHVGPDARPTICFDRGGWPPTLFSEVMIPSAWWEHHPPWWPLSGAM